MDRRTQLAVLLIALILGVNLIYTARVQKTRVAERARVAATTPEKPAAEIPASPQPSPLGSEQPLEAAPTGTPLATPAGPFPAASADAGELLIETPLQTIRIARAGGVIRELQLRKFEMTGTDAPVDLVPSLHAGADRHALGLVLRGGGTEWDLSQARFDVAPGAFDPDGRLVLEAGSGPRSFELRCEAAGGGAVVERYTIDPDRYDFQVDLTLVPGPGLPRIEGYEIAWTSGMPVTESNPKEDVQRFRAVASVNDETLRKRPGDFRKEPSLTQPGTLRWACVQSKYFMVGLIPAEPEAGTLEVAGDARTNWIGMRFAQPSPWRTGPETYRIYAGPIAFEEVKALGVGLESTVELGWGWIRPISALLLKFMEFLNNFIPNYGIIIIIVSILSRLIFWPLSAKSMQSMKRMQELQPRMEEIRRRYAKDPKAMNEQIMLMYREQKVNPLGGCMPMLIQMPIFFALFSVLQSNIELRNAPFIAWIDNLAAPDVLYRMAVKLPVIGHNLSLLPLLMGGTMIWQSLVTPTPATPAGSKPNPMVQQQFMMKWVMPIVMTFIFYNMPSGLVLYWIVSTLVGIAQQRGINRKPAVVPALVAATPRAEGRSDVGRPDRSDGQERRSGAPERAGRAGRSPR